jgi:hypothetical protein
MSVSGGGPEQVAGLMFGVSRTGKVVMADICFAHRIPHYLLAPEARPVFLFSKEVNYGTFLALYANVYTVRRLWQLFPRALCALVSFRHRLNAWGFYVS